MKCVGVKQVIKAVAEGSVNTVYVSDNAEPRIVSELISLCKEKQITLKHIKTMEELGKLAGIDVKAAAAAE